MCYATSYARSRNTVPSPMPSLSRPEPEPEPDEFPPTLEILKAKITNVPILVIYSSLRHARPFH